MELVQVKSTKCLSLRDGTQINSGLNEISAGAVAASQKDPDEAHYWGTGPGSCLRVETPVPAPQMELPIAPPLASAAAEAPGAMADDEVTLDFEDAVTPADIPEPPEPEHTKPVRRGRR